MKNYDPEVPPNPSEWLALDEHERIQLAEMHHKVTRIKKIEIEVTALKRS